MLAAIDILRGLAPELRMCVINVADLMTLQPREEHPHGLSDAEFTTLFGVDTPILFAYHGYPWLIHRRSNHGKPHVRGYKEEDTTTPFDMVVLNTRGALPLNGRQTCRVNVRWRTDRPCGGEHHTRHRGNPAGCGAEPPHSPQETV